jgi:tRNA nucleotidyltransferase (CCA-adding enzyme)
MDIRLPQAASGVIAKLNKSGYEAYAVGGCVRDCLMGRTPNDWDIATSASPAQVKACFPRTFDTGILHGTVTVLMGGTRIEVTTYRIDGPYLDGRHPSSVKYTKSLEEDLSRRDFTMNAIAYHPDSGVSDPFSGARDILAKTIRAVGDPHARFAEDALRVFRALRFSAQLGFEIETATVAAIKEKAKGLKSVSIERVREELTKLMLSHYPEKLALAYELGVLDNSLPPFARLSAEEAEKAASRLVACPKHPAAAYALAYIDRPPDGARNSVLSCMESLRFDKATARLASHLAKWGKDPIPCQAYPLRKFISMSGPENFDFLLGMRKAAGDAHEAVLLPLVRERRDKIIESGDCLLRKDLNVDGSDITKLGFKGKAVGDKLEELLEKVLEDPKLNDRETLLKLLESSADKS